MEIKQWVTVINDLCINQISAASDVYKALSELENVKVDNSLTALRETDIYRLRRGLCLPCALATCVNFLAGKPIIGEDNQKFLFSIGDFFRFLVPYHNQKNLVNERGEIYSHPWFVVSTTGDVYHQAILAFTRGLGIRAISITDFPNIDQFIPYLERGIKLALSLDNNFVLEQTLRNDPQFVSYQDGQRLIRIEGPNGLEFRRFEPGRHVVSVIGINHYGELIISDSFILPQMQAGGPLILTVSSATINSYLKYQQGGATRGIIFLPENVNWDEIERIGPYINLKVFLPAAVINSIKEEFERRKKR